MNKDTSIIALSIIIAGLLIAGGIYMSQKPPRLEPTGNATGETTKLTFKAVDENDHIRGNADAKIVLIEYSDVDCPYCKDFHKTMKEIISLYGAKNEVAWVYRHLPLDSIHPNARAKAEASECVNELGGNDKFWEFIDTIYENNPADLNGLNQIASSIGIDSADFQSCLSSGKYAEKVQKDITDVTATARSAGTSPATPFNIITTKSGENVAFAGAYPVENMIEIIDSILLSE